MLVRFGEFVLDGDTRQLTREGEVLPLSPRAFQLLQILIESRPRVVPKEELIDRLWPDVTVEEANVRNLVAEIRKVLGDHDRDPRYIRTAHRLGYAFIGPAGRLRRRSSARLEGENGTYPLSDGVNIVGRMPECAVPLDVTGVSRRHASLTVSPGRVILEDLGSKNGTWLNGTRLRASVEIRDGDQLQIGAAKLTFRQWMSQDSTTTLQGDNVDSAEHEV